MRKNIHIYIYVYIRLKWCTFLSRKKSVFVYTFFSYIFSNISAEYLNDIRFLIFPPALHISLSTLKKNNISTSIIYNTIFL